MRPQADTLSLCDSDLTASFDSAAWLPVIPGSQLCWPSGSLFYGNRGPPTPANNKPGFRKRHLGYARKGQTSKGNRSVEATASHTKEPLVFVPDGRQLRGEKVPLCLQSHPALRAEETRPGKKQSRCLCLPGLGEHMIAVLALTPRTRIC